MTGFAVVAGLLAALSPEAAPSTEPAALPVFVPVPPIDEPNRAKLIAGYISDADYPPEAQRAGESGAVIVDFDVNPQGFVTSCTIKQSSGSEVLDTRTCALIVERFRYEPPRDAAGKPTSEVKTQRVHWRLPEPSFPVAELKPMALDIELVVAPDGSVKSCVAHKFEGMGEVTDPCPGIQRVGGLKSFSGPASKRVRFRMSNEVTDE